MRGGSTASSPYLEATTAYRFSNRGSLSWNTRFGFEEPQDANSEVLVFRTSLSAVEAFTARLRGSASIGYIHSDTSSTQSLTNTTITGSTYTFDLGLDYAFTKKFSVNASYSFIDDVSSLAADRLLPEPDLPRRAVHLLSGSTAISLGNRLSVVAQRRKMNYFIKLHAPPFATPKPPARATRSSTYGLQRSQTPLSRLLARHSRPLGSDRPRLPARRRLRHRHRLLPAEGVLCQGDDGGEVGRRQAL